MADAEPLAKVQVRRLPWSDLKATGKLAAGEIVERAGETPGEQLEVEVSKETPVPVQLFTIDDPGVGAPAYALQGSVKCDGIVSPGYLEMWNFFPDGSHYFTRTLGTIGPMAALQGTGDWRPIELPFTINEPDLEKRKTMRPNKLVVNLVLPAGGKIQLGAFELAQFEETVAAQAASATPVTLPTMLTPASVLASTDGAWWSDRTGGIVGGVLGTSVGLLGGAIGVASSLSRSARLVRTLISVCSICGLGMLLFGLMALLLRQPWAVAGPILMTGLPALIVPLAIWPSVQRNFQARELRRMQALDVGG